MAQAGQAYQNKVASEETFGHIGVALIFISGPGRTVSPGVATIFQKYPIKSGIFFKSRQFARAGMNPGSGYE